MANEKAARQYACFTAEQQEAYERLTDKQRKYVDFRGQGNSKTMAYIMAGYNETVNTGQAAYLLEKRSAVVQELVACLQAQKDLRDLSIKESNINRRIDALATQESADKLMEAIESGDSETARRIQFYRDIINGRIKTVRKTTRLDKFGKRIDSKIEEVTDLETKMKARKELDKILGLNTMPDFGSLQMGDITINIVDASKKDELEDSRNDILLSPDDVQVIDGEEVIVESESKIRAKGKKVAGADTDGDDD